MKNRLTSKVVWLSVIMQVILIIGVIVPDADLDGMKTIGLAVVEICTLFGILNNPKDKENF